ncbi:flagellar export protein FliJ [Scleromatobacter humisilvae]|uniref:Flagellar FliJ protein n=1 Tax=Scleromatobacter humisilvae TaxID=2897159 RepID=A0A9X1YEX6_9BURK|nr:flagellar export protein FliJ [Scleromatobacter humisilvae]MCK9684686.1 flagellar export protein FliJ [Scleromatobacter humisilvae]
MKRLALLKTLLEREQKRRDEQMAAVRNAVANAEAQQQQADGLTGYRSEYCRKWSAQFQQAAQMEILRSYHGFLSRLDQAITQQAPVVEHARRMVDAQRQRLVEREIRVATVERLIQRREALLAKVADRRDQKNLDELAQRLSATRAQAGMS